MNSEDKLRPKWNANLPVFLLGLFCFLLPRFKTSEDGVVLVVVADVADVEDTGAGVALGVEGYRVAISGRAWTSKYLLDFKTENSSFLWNSWISQSDVHSQSFT